MNIVKKSLTLYLEIAKNELNFYENLKTQIIYFQPVSKFACSCYAVFYTPFCGDTYKLLSNIHNIYIFQQGTCEHFFLKKVECCIYKVLKKIKLLCKL